jgi:hypothetical protein
MSTTVKIMRTTIADAILTPKSSFSSLLQKELCIITFTGRELEIAKKHTATHKFN